jgi:DNA-binding Lrp family transcriptional regulator
MGGHTLEAQDAQTVEHFEQSLAQAEEVIDLRRLFGSRDYFVRVAVAALAAYETFLSSAS